MISLAYFVVFLVNGELTWLEDVDCEAPDFCEKVWQIKKELSPETLCSGNATTLIPFVEEIFSYKFEEKPEYSRLKHLLKKVILKHDVCPDLMYDWSKFS